MTKARDTLSSYIIITELIYKNNLASPVSTRLEIPPLIVNAVEDTRDNRNSLRKKLKQTQSAMFGTSVIISTRISNNKVTLNIVIK